MKREIGKIISEFIFYGSRRENFRSSVSVLPMAEMSDLARHLVKTESDLMKWTSYENTVGGPIEVAQITKEDGFMWVDTKQVFDPSKNPRQLDNNRTSSNFR